MQAHASIVRRVGGTTDITPTAKRTATLDTSALGHEHRMMREWSNEDLLQAARHAAACGAEVGGTTTNDDSRDDEVASDPAFVGRTPSTTTSIFRRPPSASGYSYTAADRTTRFSPSPAPVSPSSNTEASQPPPPPPASRRASTPQQFLRAFVSDNPWDTLHAQPALAVVGGTTALSMVSAYILQNHVLETQDHVGVFLFGSYLIFSSYFMVYYFLERFSTSFRKISQDKKFYTIGNLLKAGVLVSITPFAVYNLLLILLYDTWETNTLRNLGCIYAIPDFVSMVVVRRMAWTTWLHHICVCLFNYFSIRNDYSQENVCRLIVVYAAFSTFAYCVNMLLASRFLGVSAHVSRVLSFAALCVYVFCCAVNWVWQAHYLRKLIRDNDHWTIYLYMTLICFVMWDDIVLNRWLLQNARNTHGGILLASSAASSGAAYGAAAKEGLIPRGPRRGIRGACC
jgi:hypothetical protein